MYKEAIIRGLKFQTEVGVITVGQVYGLNLTQTANALKNVKKLLNKSSDDELAFLEEGNVTDVENELRFTILKDVYLTKKEANKAARDSRDNKIHNAKIDSLIAEKQNDSLKGMSIAELEKQRK